MKRKTLGVLVVSACFVALIAGVLFLTRSESCPFSMQVIPENTMNSIAGQKCVFLVVVADEGEGSGEGEAVNISATSPGATVTISPQAITPGQVAEVTVVPDEASTGETLTVNIKGKRGGLTQTEISTIVVEMGEDELKPYAAEMRDSFISWLAANYPEFGIRGETEWTGTIVVPYTFEVSYYLYFSEDWEMGVRWHVTIVPDDWAEIYLRKRFTETQPSHAFKIDSYGMYKRPEPHAIDPPESVWRTLSQENEENWQPPRKPLWGVPEENMVEFLKAAEKENLYLKYDNITHISFSPRFYELVEEYGGGWEDENGQIHGRQPPLPVHSSEIDENDPYKYASLIGEQLKWRGIKSRVHPPRNMELRTEGGPTYFVTSFNLYNIHLSLESGEWFEAGFGRTQPGYWNFQDPVRLYWWHGWGMRPLIQSEWSCVGLNEDETRQREISLEVEIYASGGKNYAKMEALSWVQNPDGSWISEDGIAAYIEMEWDGPLPSGRVDSTQEQAGYPTNGFVLRQDAPYTKHFSYFVKDDLGNPWYQVNQGNFSSVITKTGADPPMEMSYGFEGASENLYMDTRCRFQHDIDFITLHQVNIKVDLYVESGYRGGINSVGLYGRWGDYGGTITDSYEIWSGMTPAWVNANTGIVRTDLMQVFRLDLWNTNWENVEEWTTIASFTVTRTMLETRYLEIPFEWAMAMPEERVELETEFLEIPFYWSGAPD